MVRRSNSPGRVSAAVAAGVMLGVLAAGCESSAPTNQPELATGSKAGQYMPVGHRSSDMSALADQTQVKSDRAPKIDYAPLGPESAAGSDDTASPDSGKPATPKDDAGEKPAKTKPAADKPAPEKASAAPTKRTRLGQRLSALTNLLPGGKRPAPSAAAPSSPDAENGDEEADSESESEAAPTPAASKAARPLKAMDRREELANFPDPPTSYTPEQVQAVRNAAEAEAQKSLLRAVFSSPLDPTSTVGEAIGQGVDDFPGKLEGLEVIRATWKDDKTLEIEVQINVLSLVDGLSKAYEGVTFDPLKALGEDKFVAAVGTAKVPGTDSPKSPAPKKSRPRGGPAIQG